MNQITKIKNIKISSSSSNKLIPELIKFLTIFVTFLFAFIYLNSAFNHAANVNVSSDIKDQGAFIHHIRDIYESDYTYFGNRNRMPLYPVIQSLFYESSLSSDVFFHQTKMINIAISVLFILLILYVTRNILSRWEMVIFALVFTFTLFLLRAPYLHPEVTFFGLFFIAILYSMLSLKENNKKYALISGFTLALAYLTKASALLYFYILLFSFVISLLVLIIVFIRKRKIIDLDLFKKSVSIFIILITFLITASPYLIDNIRLFNDPFLNVNTKYYIWYDTWEEAKENFQPFKEDDSVWPGVPYKEVKTLRYYLKNTDIGTMIHREISGLRFLKNEITDVHSMHSISMRFPIVLSLLALITTILNWRRTKEYLKKYYYELSIFLFYIISTFLLNAWYVPIAEGARIIQILHLPLLFASLVVLQNYDLKVKLPGSLKEVNFKKYLYIIILVLLFIDIYFILGDVMPLRITGT